MTAPAALYYAVQEAAQACRGAIVTGPNPNDLTELPDGAFVQLLELVTLAHAELGRTAVVRSSLGVVQDPVPGRAPARLRLPSPEMPPGAALRELHDQLLRSTEPVVVVVNFAQLALPASLASGQANADQQLFIETLARFPVDERLALHRIVVLDRGDDLDPRLARLQGWEVIEVGLPDEELRLRFAHRLDARAHDGDVARLADGYSVQEFARDAGGLRLDEMRRLAAAAHERGDPLGPERVRDAKSSRLCRVASAGLEVLADGPTLDDIAGLPQVRLFIEEHLLAGVWPRALVLAGPPGVGKSIVVHAIARALCWVAVAIGNLRGPYLGETERNTREALAAIEAMAPLVVFQDEVDQAMGQREVGASADGGASARLMAEFWKFLGDSNSGLPVLFIMATNRPDLLDNAMRSRAEIIPVLHPTESEQIRLLELACARQGTPISPELAGLALVEADLGVVSGRVLVKLAQRAQVCARASGHETIELADLRRASSQLLERVHPIEDERMALKAIAAASFSTYLPWVAAKQLGQHVELLPYVAPLVDADGALDLERLHARIGELDRLAGQRRG